MSNRYSLIIIAIGLLASMSSGAEEPSLQDAALHDVFFIDSTHGWAVGDQGVIWHTEDGGRTWTLQSSGTVCSLRSVWFVDRNAGWAVGGQGLPYTAGSRGLVLATVDGGRTWQSLNWDQFPRFHRVQFLNAKSGWVWGEASEYFSSGLFSSDNSGRLLNPASGSVGAGWLAGFFPSAETGVLAGESGTTALLLGRTVQPVSIGMLGTRSIRSLKFSNDGTGYAVADGGVVLRSNNRGANWSVIQAGLPSEVAPMFDWRGVHSVGVSVWVVGRPGTVILHSADGGGTWQTIPTGQTIPLQAVWFHDRHRGWAVGSLGTILSTQDGGQTWQMQRRGGERMALLSIHGSAQTAQLLAHVQLGAEQGYLMTGLSMVGPSIDAHGTHRMRLESRLGDAVRVAGGAQAEIDWRFPSNQTALTLPQALEHWNRLHEGRALTELERRIVMAIRTWQPDVILADSPDPSNSVEPASALVSQAVERAMHSAADATAFPELARYARLAPWSVKKLYVFVRETAESDASLDASTLSHRAEWAGRPLEDQVHVAGSLLYEEFRAAPGNLHFRCTASRIRAPSSDNGLMGGIVLEPGGPARRQLRPPVEITDAHRRAVQARRNVIAVVQRADAQPALARQLNAHVGGLLNDLTPDQAGNILFHLARTHFKQGRWSEARDLLEKLVADYPNPLTAAEARRWLVQYYASSEARHREQVAGFAGQAIVEPQRLRNRVDVAPRQETDPSGINEPASAAMSARHQSGAIGGLASDVPWLRGALESSKHLAQWSPLVWSEPPVQFALAAAHRSLGNVKDADKFYSMFALGRDTGPWSDAARSERWIRDREGMPSKPILLAQPTNKPPHLDGSLDDPVWKSCAAISLENIDRGSDENWETKLRCAYDQRFLYFAIGCYAAGGDAPPPHRPRTRDMDLSAFDRVDLYLDLDRDYTTYYHLAADRRGCVFEDCWGDASWNPTWYVASQGDEHGYRIEAAIPLAELTGGALTDQSVWAFNAIRQVPGRRVMAWSRTPGIAPRPENMGLLMFGAPSGTPIKPAVAN